MAIHYSKQVIRTCPQCNIAAARENAKFCHACGYKLPVF